MAQKGSKDGEWKGVELTERHADGPWKFRSAGEGRIDDGGVRRPGEEEEGDQALRGLLAPASSAGR